MNQQRPSLSQRTSRHYLGQSEQAWLRRVQVHYRLEPSLCSATASTAGARRAMVKHHKGKRFGRHLFVSFEIRLCFTCAHQNKSATDWANLVRMQLWQRRAIDLAQSIHHLQLGGVRLHWLWQPWNFA